MLLPGRPAHPRGSHQPEASPGLVCSVQAVELAAQKKARIALAEQQMELRRAQAASPARPSLVRRWVSSVMPGREAQPEQQVQGLRHEVGCGDPASHAKHPPSGSTL